ncbi:MAG: 6-bladed beta-propeller [Acidobacteriota bacterium]|nr:6-bladed beta-propeller [Acidobacteriota bacterium]
MLLILCVLMFEEPWTIRETECFQPLQLNEVRVHPNGEVFVLNFSESRVQHYDARGNFVRNIGRRGKGPGEFTYPAQFFLFEDKLYIYDFLESIVSVFKTDGSFITRYPTPVRNVILAKIEGGWVYGTWGMIAMGGPAELVWADETFTETRVLLEIDDAGYSQGNWTADGPDGRPMAVYSKLPTRPQLIASPDFSTAYFADNHGFHIKVIDAAKKAVVHTIDRDDPPIPFDDEWGRSGSEEVRERRKRNSPGVRFVVNTPEYFPVIRQVAFDPAGRMVVDRWRGKPDENHHAVVIDDNGRELPEQWRFEELLRLVGVVKGFGYVSCFDEASEEASIVRVPLQDVPRFVAANPLFSRETSRTINIGR